MESNPNLEVRAIMILKADRLYAESLRQLTQQVFPLAKIRLAWSVDSARAALSTEAVELLITGIGASLGGDVLDFVSGCTGAESRVRRVLVVTTHHEFRLLTALRSLPIYGVFDSAVDQPEQFLGALELVARGDYFWSHSILSRISTDSASGQSHSRVLTACEQLVLSVIGGGSDNATAARELGLSPSTISSVRRDLHRKLGVQHRGELMRVAAEAGFVQFTSSGVIRPGFGMLTAAHQSRRGRRDQLAVA